jgi:hypothetical protein
VIPGVVASVIVMKLLPAVEEAAGVTLAAVVDWGVMVFWPPDWGNTSSTAELVDPTFCVPAAR